MVRVYYCNHAQHLDDIEFNGPASSRGLDGFGVPCQDAPPTTYSGSQILSFYLGV